MVRLALLLLAVPLLIGDAFADKRTLSQEKSFSVTVQPESQRSTQCEARVRVSYAPINEEVDVTATLTNDTCGASSGEFTLVVRLRGDDSNLEEVEHLERWSRDDDAPITLARRFPLPQEKSLVRVSARRVRCRCAPPAE